MTETLFVTGQLPEWLTTSLSGTSDLPVIEMAARLVLAAICGIAIAAIYRLVRPRGAISPTFPPTLVLLAILCAMLPQIIGQNVAWAFGLVGALSIVRFRTIATDTHDITFVLFAVLVGMAVGAGRLPIAGVGMAVVGATAFLVKPRDAVCRWTNADAKLSVRIAADQNPASLFQTVAENQLDRFEFLSGETSGQGKSITLKYLVRLRSHVVPTDLIEQLNRLDGVQSVELRRG